MMRASIIILLGLLAVVEVRGACLTRGAGCVGSSDCCPIFFDGSDTDEICCKYAEDSTVGFCLPTDFSGDCVAGGKTTADPMFEGFDGSQYHFNPTPHTYWNLISERQHLVNAWFTPAKLWDHNGTYITAFGYKYGQDQIAVRVDEEGALSVIVNGETLKLAPDQVAMTLSLENNEGALNISWSLYQPYYGNRVVISTPKMTFSTWAVAPGTVDDGGLAQPAYLDSSTTLSAPPAGNAMAGVLGDTYGNLLGMLRGRSFEKAEPGPVTEITKAAYQVKGLFDTDFLGNLFGAPSGSRAERRRLSEMEDKALVAINDAILAGRMSAGIGGFPLTRLIKSGI